MFGEIDISELINNVVSSIEDYNLYKSVIQDQLLDKM